MRIRHYLVVFIATFLGSFFLASCLNEDNKIPPNCYDGILNNGEVMIDCGGPCKACDHCIDGIWQPQLGETCRDCGGECGICDQCHNCIKDGDEFGIDCGGTYCGPCAALCDDGLLNGSEEEIDCGGIYCDACPTCTDDLMNGTEIGIDCGGIECLPCPTDGSCKNLQMDGDEFWVDCGGTTCPACDTIVSYTANGTLHQSLMENITFSFDGSQLDIEGISLMGGTLNISMDEPLAGWVEGVSININPTTVGKYITFTNEFGVAFGMIPGTSASGNLTIVRIEDTPLPGIIRGTFSGTLYNVTGDQTVSISNGLFMIPQQ